jgi:hypothetical protein
MPQLGSLQSSLRRKGERLVNGNTQNNASFSAMFRREVIGLSMTRATLARASRRLRPMVKTCFHFRRAIVGADDDAVANVLHPRRPGSREPIAVTLR